MDGVLVDGEPLHYRAFSRLLADEGLSYSLERHKASMGTKGDWPELVTEFGLRKSADYYLPVYSDYVMAEYAACDMPLPGAVKAVDGLRARNVPVAVASSSRRPWVETCLRSMGLGGSFDVVVTGSEVSRGKPDPEVYLLAAERLGADPARCLAIEDAPFGILAAHAAGMICWAVRTEYTADIELPGPEREMQSLLEFDLSVFDEVAV
jgi:HAD superfamily hydrolase (TIGR01509 family)